MRPTSFSYRPNAFFISVLLSTTFFWSIGAVISFTDKWADFFMLPMLFGLMMPAIVAIRFIWRQPGEKMKSDFLNRIFNVRLIKPIYFVGALLLMPLSVLISIVLSIFFGGSTDQFVVSEAFSFNSGFIPVLLLLFLAAIFEELGWRGYGFESLERGRSFLSASIIFGIIWSLWHLPLLVVNNSYQFEIFQQSPWFAANFFVGTALMGIIVSWVCHINNRSILATILFHFAINLSQEMLSMTQETKCIQTLVLAVFTLVIVATQKELFFGVKTKHQEAVQCYQ